MFRLIFAAFLLLPVLVQSAVFYGKSHGKLNSLHYSRALDENGERLSCGVRFHLHTSFMAGKSRDAKEERITGLVYAANKTFAGGPDFDIHIYEIIHEASLDTGGATDANTLLTLAEDATVFDHKACANVWMMHIQADANTVGIAYVGGSCDGQCYGEYHIGLVTLSPVVYGGNTAEHFVDEAWVLSHELGHLVGASHVNGNSVMNPSIVSYTTAQNGFTWDSISLQQISQHMQGDCSEDTCLVAYSHDASPHITCADSHCHYTHGTSDWFFLFFLIPAVFLLFALYPLY